MMGVGSEMNVETASCKTFHYSQDAFHAGKFGEQAMLPECRVTVRFHRFRRSRGCLRTVIFPFQLLNGSVGEVAHIAIVER